MRALTPLICLSLACSGDAPPPTPDDTEEDTGVGWPEDTSVGTDDDGDGWSVEEGDCDDADIYVNPGRDEDVGDGVDNDCDGRTDEQFSGLVTVQVGDGSILPTLHGIDTLGGGQWLIELDDPEIAPYFMTAGVGDGWLIGDYGGLVVYAVDPSGATTPVADLSEDYAALYGMVTHPDGYYLALTVRINEDTGAYIQEIHSLEPSTWTMTSLASWDPTTEIWGFYMDLDPGSGEVGVFGLYGGFGLFYPSAGLLDVKIPIPEVPELTVYSGCHRDGGGWYAGGFGAEGFQIHALDEDLWSWSPVFTWDSQWSPTFMACEGDSGDFYVSANGASYPTVWRVLADGSQQSQFYASEIQGGLTNMWDIYVTY